MTRDVSEGIDTARWTVYGKINRVRKLSAGTTIDYGYDPGGNRSTKKLVAGSSTTTTYYIRDAQGNVLAVYSKKDQEALQWQEQHLYGSSRLGMWQWDSLVPAAPPVLLSGNSLEDSLLIGVRTYELSNHLGNVLATISDKKAGHNNSGVVDYYEPEVLSQNDYYPFGMEMPGRKYLALNGYRYGFNGQEKETEINGSITSAQFWVYDSRIARRWNVDPKPNISISVYATFGNNPIWYSDHLGDTLRIKGDETFKKNTQKYLLTIAQTDKGKEIIDRLNSSKEVYTIDEVWIATNSQYNSGNKTISYDDNPWRKTLDGGAVNGTIILAHELYHAYQDDLGIRPTLSRATAETQATYFQNYITSVFSYGNLRTSYTGVGRDIFPNDEAVYNPNTEKISSLGINKNQIRQPIEIVLGNARSDNTTQRIKVTGNITDPGYSVQYEKKYRINGREMKQSMKKANEKKIAKDR